MRMCVPPLIPLLPPTSTLSDSRVSCQDAGDGAVGVTRICLSLLSLLLVFVMVLFIGISLFFFFFWLAKFFCRILYIDKCVDFVKTFLF